ARGRGAGRNRTGVPGEVDRPDAAVVAGDVELVDAVHRLGEVGRALQLLGDLFLEVRLGRLIGHVLLGTERARNLAARHQAVNERRERGRAVCRGGDERGRTEDARAGEVRDPARVGGDGRVVFGGEA